MVIRKNKKAVLFTVTAILLITIILYYFTLQTEYRLRNQAQTIETRVDTMNSFIHDIEKDIERGVYITGYRALLGIIQYETSNGVYVESITDAFFETFVNGTINNSYAGLLNNNTFINWTDKMKIQSDRIDIGLNFILNSLDVYHVDPWYINLDINLTILVTDKKQTASWTRDEFVSSRINILGFEDPTYMINTLGKVTNTIAKTNVTQFVDRSTNDTSQLQYHVNNSLYSEWTGAPSFLMRLEGNFSNSSFGIESFVDIEELRGQGLTISSRSNIDYIYFSDIDHNVYQILNMPDDFGIDDESNGTITHLEKYDVDGLEISQKKGKKKKKK